MAFSNHVHRVAAFFGLVQPSLPNPLRRLVQFGKFLRRGCDRQYDIGRNGGKFGVQIFSGIQVKKLDRVFSIPIGRIRNNIQVVFLDDVHAHHFFFNPENLFYSNCIFFWTRFFPEYDKKRTVKKLWSLVIMPVKRSVQLRPIRDLLSVWDESFPLISIKAGSHKLFNWRHTAECGCEHKWKARIRNLRLVPKKSKKSIGCPHCAHQVSPWKIIVRTYCKKTSRGKTSFRQSHNM